jgi:hypothetical protein
MLELFMMKARQLIAILLFSLIAMFSLGACSPLLEIAGVNSGNSENTPFFMDDFTDHQNGWKLTIQDEGIVQYDGDAIRMLIKNPGTELWSTPGISVKDSSINVDAEKISGPDNNLFGLICRYKDADNFYAFLVSSDGYYAIVKNIGGERKILSSDSFEPSGFIQKGASNNHIRADCVDKTLTLYVNWEKVDEVPDIDLSSGDVGIIAGTFTEPGSDIKFDNFIVIETNK